jgi:hypothetical protein
MQNIQGIVRARPKHNNVICRRHNKDRSSRILQYVETHRGFPRGSLSYSKPSCCLRTSVTPKSQFISQELYVRQFCRQQLSQDFTGFLGQEHGTMCPQARENLLGPNRALGTRFEWGASRDFLPATRTRATLTQPQPYQAGAPTCSVDHQQRLA